ncbi:MAG: MmgE/PrpD family protein, partial [Clostridiaceae bacterium]|nr:MmgE/PrpD family protein [Clostridiaceae bacterium]
MSLMNLTDDFLKKIEDLFAKEIPDRVYQRARIALLDYLAVSVAGTAGQADRLEKYLRETDPEAGSIAVIGM